MIRFIVLDAGPLGILSNPTGSATASECRRWLNRAVSSGVTVVVPAISDYEVRRELVRTNRRASLKLLDALVSMTTYAELTDDALKRAADLWAQIRNEGQPTAGKDALDGDVILAAQILELDLPIDKVVVATANMSHISRFLPAAHWRDIAIGDE
jgi:predicted nucleic acid-binding protein